MKIVLVEPKSPDFHVFEKFALPRMGLPMIGTILKNAGHEVIIFCEDIAPIDWADVYSADLVGVSSITVTAPNAYVVGDKVRAKGIPVVMGGVHPTFLPEEALEHSDYVVRGEGEEVILEFIEVLDGKREPSTVKGLSFKKDDGEFEHVPMKPLIQDLDALPFADITLIRGHKRIPLTPIVTSRGCPYDCTFCSVTPMFGRGYRFRSPENVLDEIEEKKADKVFFYDDMFNAKRDRMFAILQGIVDRGLKLLWNAQVRTNIVKHKGKEDVEMLTLMKKSGAGFLYIGFESINPETLKAFNKGQDVDDIVESIKLIQKYDITIHGMFVLGSDMDTAETVRSTADFAIKNRIDTVQFMILTPLPGSEDFKKLDDQGRIFNKNWRSYNAHYVVYWPTLITAADLQLEVTRAMRRFYSVRQVFSMAIRRRWYQMLYRAYGHWVLRQWVKLNKGTVRELREYTKNVPIAIREKIPTVEIGGDSEQIKPEQA